MRVRFAETDAQGVVYHTNYIVWFEVGRGEYSRAAGFPYKQIEQEGYGLVVTDLHIKYYSPARYDDEMTIKTWLEQIGRASCVFGYQIYNETSSKLAVEGFTKHAAVTPAGKLVRLSPKLYQTLAAGVGRGPGRLTLPSR